MQLEVKKLIEDIRVACEDILGFTADKTLDDYKRDRLTRTGPATAEQITHHKRIISFRNILIHGYDLIEDSVVWDIVAKDLPLLHSQVVELLAPEK